MKRKNNYLLGILLVIAPACAYFAVSFIVSTIVQFFYYPSINVPPELGTDVKAISDYVAAELAKTSYMSVANILGMVVGSIVAFVWLLSLRKYFLPAAKVFTLKRTGMLISEGFFAQGVISLVLALIAVLFPAYITSAQALTGRLTGTEDGSVLMMIATAIGAPIAEEFFFRGLALRYAKKFVPEGWAIALSSIAFGSMHFANLQLGNDVLFAVCVQAVYAAALGVVLAKISLKFKSIWASVIVHASINTVAVVNSLFPGVGVLILFGLAILGGVIFILFRKSVGGPDELTEAEKAEAAANA